MIDNNKVCFIIAHKYFRGYESYLHHYITNVKTHYPEALVIVVDNNSVYKNDIFDGLRNLKDIILLDNTIESKLELGAYQVGLKYVMDNELYNSYKYFVFTQDTFILKNKYDFTSMSKSNTFARPIVSMYADGECRDVCDIVMNKLGMNDNWDKVNFCWCCSFVVINHKLEQLYSYLKNIVVKTRWESCAAERYLARILWELNEHRECGDIDGSATDLAIRHYDTWTVNPYNPVSSYFVKKVQQKTEKTIDSDISQKIAHLPLNVLQNFHNSENK